MSPENRPVLRFGLANLMADGALRATERQFQRLLDGGAQLAFPDEAARPECLLLPFSFPEIERAPEAAAYVAENYAGFEELSAAGLDALIVTGANIATPGLPQQAFWEPLTRVLEWSRRNVRSTLCSCLATHAVLEARYRRKRTRMPQKLWGVYRHEVLDRRHPLVAGLPALVDVPHSRHNEITVEQFEAAGLRVLIAGDEGGAHLVVADGDGSISPLGCHGNQIRKSKPTAPPCPLILMQGHPEYDDVSLLKEYRREIGRFARGERQDYPPLLDWTLDETGEMICRQLRREVLDAVRAGRGPQVVLPEFPEEELVAHVRGTWHEPVTRMFGNWVASLASGGSM